MDPCRDGQSVSRPDGRGWCIDVDAQAGKLGGVRDVDFLRVQMPCHVVNDIEWLRAAWSIPDRLYDAYLFTRIDQCGFAEPCWNASIWDVEKVCDAGVLVDETIDLKLIDAAGGDLFRLYGRMGSICSILQRAHDSGAFL